MVTAIEIVLAITYVMYAFILFLCFIYPGFSRHSRNTHGKEERKIFTISGGLLIIISVIYSMTGDDGFTTTVSGTLGILMFFSAISSRQPY
ncbi:MAG: hypothetical protein Q8Q23_04055 [bacterium]|nr:hypothetical protein [bacterium]